MNDAVTLVLHWGSASCRVGLIQSGRVLAAHSIQPERDKPVVLPQAVDVVLASAGMTSRQIDLIAVVVAPGGFTALRSIVAFSRGFGLSLGIPVAGVTEGQAFRQTLGRNGRRELWCCWTDRLGQILLDRDGVVTAFPPADLPVPTKPIILAGEAGDAVGALLAARGADVQLSSRRVPDLVEIATAGQSAALAGTHDGEASPIYAEPPAVRTTTRDGRAPPIP